MGNWMDAGGNAASGAATGFAFGGPVGAAIGGGLGLLSGFMKPEQEVVSEQKIKDLMKPMQGYADEFKGRSEDLWDINSVKNQMMRRQLQQQGLDQAAQSSMLANRNFSGGGISNPAIQNTMLGGFQQKAQDTSQRGFSDFYSGNLKESSGLLGEAMGAQGNIQDTLTQAYLSRMSMENQQKADSWNTLTSGITSAGSMIAGMPGGGGNALGLPDFSSIFGKQKPTTDVNTMASSGLSWG